MAYKGSALNSFSNVSRGTTLTPPGVKYYGQLATTVEFCLIHLFFH